MATPRSELDEAELRLKAFELWQARGCPVGSPEEDWFRAQSLLKAQKTEASPMPGPRELPLGLRLLEVEKKEKVELEPRQVAVEP